MTADERKQIRGGEGQAAGPADGEQTPSGGKCSQVRLRAALGRELVIQWGEPPQGGQGSAGLCAECVGDRSQKQVPSSLNEKKRKAKNQAGKQKNGHV